MVVIHELLFLTLFFNLVMLIFRVLGGLFLLIATRFLLVPSPVFFFILTCILLSTLSRLRCIINQWGGLRVL